MKTWWHLKIVEAIGMIAVASLALGFVVMALWNALIPDLFRGPSLTFWQAVGLLLLAHILLRGWGPWRHFYGWRHDRWRQRFEERLAAMTPENREKFKAESRRWCGEQHKESQDTAEKEQTKT
jgi:hypothetical protein